MKYGIIDIGSNSVRLLISGKKHVINTQLAENLMNVGVLCEEAMRRTEEAIASLCVIAEGQGAKVCAFATEAVRAAKNGDEFVDRVNRMGVSVEVLRPEDEAKIGFIGAYNSGTEGILDIGGASSELAVGTAEGLLYAHSLPLGSVRLKDYAPDAVKQAEYARSRVREYGEVPHFDRLIAIGGTLSQLCAVMKELDPYDPNEVHGTVMTRADVKAAVDKILAFPVEKRITIKGLHPKKILVAPAGGILALEIMDYLGEDKLIVSETDNLEGYAILRKLDY